MKFLRRVSNSGIVLAVLAISLVLSFIAIIVIVDAARTTIDQSNSKLHSLETLLKIERREKAENRATISELQNEVKNLREHNEGPLPGIVLARGDTRTKDVAITIDDGFSPAMVTLALKTIEDDHIKATFFPIGRIVSANPAPFKRAVQDGVELGNHTYNHAWLTQLNADQIEGELDSWQKAVNEAMGFAYPTHWFRPPGMAGFTDGVGKTLYRSILAKHNLNTALWSLDTYSAIYKHRGLNVPPEVVARYIVDNTQGGTIILMHFVRPDIGALPLVVQGLKARGFTFVTLSGMPQQKG